MKALQRKVQKKWPIMLAIILAASAFEQWLSASCSVAYTWPNGTFWHCENVPGCMPDTGLDNVNTCVATSAKVNVTCHQDGGVQTMCATVFQTGTQDPCGSWPGFHPDPQPTDGACPE